ncbi:hypothetical protein OsI_18170 [Oryza sativa Indica Group]|uniref:Uncharacterized protein n=1 Tax=Oryza sativa subsp. indica TaxID=39946 RepID=A2XZL1_ORYSI|nr:hypothetical protein OsI_18170 [Oryza sativa Indica Group]
MVADVAAMKLATKTTDCGACRDASPRQEPRRHEGGASPVNYGGGGGGGGGGGDGGWRWRLATVVAVVLAVAAVDGGARPSSRADDGGSRNSIEKKGTVVFRSTLSKKMAMAIEFDLNTVDDTNLAFHM